MEIQEDYKEFLRLFNAHVVEYLVVGGYALAFYGKPRFTGDLDLLINRDRKNAERVFAALRDFGFGSLELSVEDFMEPEQVVQLGLPPIRIDIVTSLDGISWNNAWKGKLSGTYDDIPVHFIGRKEFIANKRATGRSQDLADIEALGDGK